MQIRKIITIASLPMLVLVLAGCGKQNTVPQKTEAPISQPAQVSTPERTQPTNVENQLSPLPADNKAVIDQEINESTKLLDENKDDTTANDLSNTELGL
jgi:hypothetical protein